MHLVHDPKIPAAPTIEFDRFVAVDIRVGTIVAAESFPEACNQSSAPFVMSSSSYRSATKARYKPNIRWQEWTAGFIIVTHEF